MKKLFYFIYSLLFRMYRLFPVKENRISLVSPHNAGFNDSLKFVKEEFEKRGDYEFNFVSSKQLGSFMGTVRFFFTGAYKTATSSFIFLNDNFMPFSNVTFSKRTKLIQLWHGQGAFKKFGLSTDLPEEERTLAQRCAEKYDYIVVSSENVSGIYAEAFGISKKKIIACGIPESDFFIDTEIKGDFRQQFSIPESKKIALYAPTFRGCTQDSKNILDSFDAKRFIDELSEEYQLVVRQHPQIHSDKRLTDWVIDATDYDDLNSLIIDSDLLITDYSSICMEFAYTDKPMIFYAYDLDEYKNDRDFYFDYSSYVPGKIVFDMDELIDAIKKSDFQMERIVPFKKINFDYQDGNSTKRLVDFLLKAK